MTTDRPSIAGEIRAECARQGITAGDLAGRAGLTPAAMSRRLNGHTEFTLREVIAVCAALGIDLAQLMRAAA